MMLPSGAIVTPVPPSPGADPELEDADPLDPPDELPELLEAPELPPLPVPPLLLEPPLLPLAPPLPDPDVEPPLLEPSSPVVVLLEEHPNRTARHNKAALFDNIMVNPRFLGSRRRSLANTAKGPRKATRSRSVLTLCAY